MNEVFSMRWTRVVIQRLGAVAPAQEKFLIIVGKGLGELFALRECG